MHAHPRRVADDDAEPAARCDVREVRGETERQRTAVLDSPSKRAKATRGRAQLRRRGPLVTRRLIPIAEKVAALSRDEHVSSFCRDGSQLVPDGLGGEYAL